MQRMTGVGDVMLVAKPEHATQEHTISTTVGILESVCTWGFIQTTVEHRLRKQN